MEFLSNAYSELPPPFNMVVAIIAIICVVSLVGEVIKQIRLFADHEGDRRLKRDMIEAGYTSEEAQHLAELAVTRDYEPKKTSS